VFSKIEAGQRRREDFWVLCKGRLRRNDFGNGNLGRHPATPATVRAWQRPSPLDKRPAAQVDPGRSFEKGR